MVYTFDEVAEHTCTDPSQKRHHSLKEAEKNAITNMGRHRVRFRMMPLAIDTAKQSIARPAASSQISKLVIVYRFIIIIR